MFVLPRVIGHRGAAASAPENTLAGLRAAAALGATWVEFDVMLTKDRVPVLFHDDNLRRITGRDALMAETSYAELASSTSSRPKSRSALARARAHSPSPSDWPEKRPTMSLDA